MSLETTLYHKRRHAARLLFGGLAPQALDFDQRLGCAGLDGDHAIGKGWVQPD